ncbi:aspartyl/asparaginyl beta-hydroxylase domain-containing protein [Andreprevotia chitinilytica]|uniref:aspartyl/asparaginyl beta-hydroxylase domain-containing protein n=1 Tax=Andreprevotia chitinilytica TaxID=396808 RepID=UPI000550BCD1|nr:aspartyl/asparaginyl beta-hydroxylase domain-containing protein [Andreprevotia chitinilytica]
MPDALPLCARLPIAIHIEPLLAALARVPADAWQPHFNTGYFSGDWSGVALIAPANAVLELAPGSGEPKPTKVFAGDPAWQAALNQIDAPIRSARLLRLGPGAAIREHADFDLAGPDSDLRIHLPLRSHEAVEFLLEGHLVPMRPGECWFLDLSRPHRVDNPSPHDRIHLVLDCQRSPWLLQAIAAGAPTTPTLGLSRGRRAFAEFQALIAADANLADALLAIEEHKQFIETVVALGQQHGHAFSEEDVQSVMRQSRQRWQQQWMA